MPPVNIQKIERDYRRRQFGFKAIMLYIFIIFFMIFLSIFFPDIIKYNYINRAFGLFTFIFFLIVILTPFDINLYFLILFHFNKLIFSLKRYDSNNATKHLDRLVKNITSFEYEIESLTVFTSTKELFHKLKLYLKYQVYPKIENNIDEINLELLNDLSKSLYEENSKTLKELIEGHLDNNSQLNVDDNLLLPHEKSNYLMRGIVFITNVIKRDSTIELFKNKYVTFTLIFCSLLFVVSKIVVIDGTSMAAILTVSIVLARN